MVQQFMDGAWLIPGLSAVFGGGGIWAFCSARSTARATERAAALAAAPAVAAASTADWTSLMTYWQGEMAAMRQDATRLEVRLLFLEKVREADQEHIAALESHIWNELPPPPPVRRHVAPPQGAGS